MPKPTINESAATGQQVTRSRVALTKERAYSTPKRIVDINKKIRNASKLMDEAFRDRDVKTYCETSKVWASAMDLWLRIVAYPKPATLKHGEQPFSEMFPVGGAKYMGDAALVDITDDSPQEPAMA